MAVAKIKSKDRKKFNPQEGHFETAGYNDYFEEFQNIFKHISRNSTASLYGMGEQYNMG